MIKLNEKICKKELVRMTQKKENYATEVTEYWWKLDTWKHKTIMKMWQKQKLQICDK